MLLNDDQAPRTEIRRMSARRGLAGFLAAMAIAAAMTVTAPPNAHADWQLDIWIQILMREGDPDTPDLIVKGPDGSDTVVKAEGLTQDQFLAQFEEILSSILAALN
jgi:hypothetical protein